MEALSMSNADVAPSLARGRYRLIEEIGVGGMATVYRGHDDRLGRQVAVKVMKPDLASNSTLRARFEQEARTMARLDVHRHVVQIYDFGQDDEDQRLYIAMELLGRSLQQVLDRHGRLPPRLASELMVQVLEALEVAHRHRVVHRDVKPSNILLTREGDTKVSDFGIARIMSPRDQAKLTRTGAGVGTWAFMAPEQKRDAGTVDHRADIYAVGATLFALVTNQEPHDIDRAETWREQLEAIPEALRDVITRATSYQPDDRYDSAAELRAALTEAILVLPPDPPGAEALLAMGLRTAPDPVAPVTLVPAAAGVPSVESAQHSSLTGPWPPPGPSDTPLRWGVVALLALAVTGIGWWFMQAPPAPPPAPASAAGPPTPTVEPIASASVEPAAPAAPVIETAAPPSASVDGAASSPSPPSASPERPRTASAASNPSAPAPAAPEASPTGPITPGPIALGPIALGKVRVRVDGTVNCTALIDGVAQLPGMPNKLFATVGSNAKASPPQDVPLGRHTFACAGGEPQEATITADQAAPPTVVIRLKGPP